MARVAEQAYTVTVHSRTRGLRNGPPSAPTWVSAAILSLGLISPPGSTDRVWRRAWRGSVANAARNCAESAGCGTKPSASQAPARSAASAVQRRVVDSDTPPRPSFPRARMPHAAVPANSPENDLARNAASGTRPSTPLPATYRCPLPCLSGFGHGPLKSAITLAQPHLLQHALAQQVI
jgi:hypothetical protein